MKQNKTNEPEKNDKWWDKADTISKFTSSVVIAIVGIWLSFSIQKVQIKNAQTQAETQLAFAKLQAENQLKLQQSDLTAKLADSLASNDSKKREIAIIALQRSVPVDTYESVLQVLIREDSDPKVREQAIKRLSNSTNAGVISALNDVERDASRPKTERQLAQRAARNISLYSDLPESTCIISAAAPGYLVSDSSKYGGSLFSSLLAEGISGKADLNNDHIVKSSELYTFINNQIQYDSNGSQIPFMASTKGFDVDVVNHNPMSHKLFGVVIGISKYKTGLDLQNADKDARHVFDVLSKTYKADNTSFVLLTNENGTRDKILSTLEQLRHKITLNDMFIIYFSGHGSSDQRGFLEWLPFDFTFDDRSSSININTIKSFLKTFSAKGKLVLMDTAYPISEE